MTTRIGVLAFLLVTLFLWGAYIWPKSCTLGGGTHGGLVAMDYVGYYRGLGLDVNPGVFGRDYYRVRLVSRRAEDGFTNVAFGGAGWNRFRGTYPNGTLREEGECWVTMNFGVEPFPDLHHVRNGKYYDPTGKLRCEIKDGSGTQTYWNCNGIKVWQMEVKNCKRLQISMWYDNGQLLTERRYLDNHEDGPIVSYYPSGAKKLEGILRRDLRIGKWVEYDMDGKVKDVTDYGEGKW